MSKKLKVICDYDGTIVTIMPQWCAELRKLGFVYCYPDNLLNYTLLENSCLTGCSKEQLYEALTRVNYCTVPWIAGAYWNIPSLVYRYDFTFISCQPVDQARQMAAKTARLQTLIPEAVVNFELFAESRLELIGDVLIDDRLDIIVAWCARYPRRYGILVDQPYNKVKALPANAVRVFGWAEITSRLAAWSAETKAREMPLTEVAAPKFATDSLRPVTEDQPPLYPSEAKSRKAIPLYSGFIAYFPKALSYVTLHESALHNWQPAFDALLGQYSEEKDPQHLAMAWYYLANLHEEGEDGLKRDVARVSYLGNEQHSPGELLHWARGKSMDQLDAAARHEAEYRHGVREDAMGYPVIGQIGWRVMAELQLRLETIENSYRAAKVPPMIAATAEIKPASIAGVGSRS